MDRIDESRPSDKRSKEDRSSKDDNKNITIVVNNEQIVLDKQTMTGLEIRERCGRDGSFLLIRLDENEGEHSEGISISNDESVQLENNTRFRLVPNPTFGRSNAH